MDNASLVLKIQQAVPQPRLSHVPTISIQTKTHAAHAPAILKCALIKLNQLNANQDSTWLLTSALK